METTRKTLLSSDAFYRALKEPLGLPDNVTSLSICAKGGPVTATLTMVLTVDQGEAVREVLKTCFLEQR